MEDSIKKFNLGLLVLVASISTWILQKIILNIALTFVFKPLAFLGVVGIGFLDGLIVLGGIYAIINRKNPKYKVALWQPIIACLWSGTRVAFTVGLYF